MVRSYLGLYNVCSVSVISIASCCSNACFDPQWLPVNGGWMSPSLVRHWTIRRTRKIYSKNSFLWPATFCHQRLFLSGRSKVVGDRIYCTIYIYIQYSSSTKVNVSSELDTDLPLITISHDTHITRPRNNMLLWLHVLYRLILQDKTVCWCNAHYFKLADCIV